MTLYFKRVHNDSEDCGLPYGLTKLNYNNTTKILEKKYLNTEILKY